MAGAAHWKTHSLTQAEPEEVPESTASIEPGRRRDCHFADSHSRSLLKHLLKVEEGAAE